MDYQQHPKTRGLGPIGNGSHHGFLLQTVLAVVPQSRQVLGIAHQEPFLRQPAPAKETRQQRLQRERESQVWERSVQALGSPPEGVRWVHIGDRYSDIFSFLRLCRELHCDFVIRAAQDRCVDLLVEQAERPVPARSHHAEHPSPAAQHLFEVVESWPAQASSTVEIDASQKRKARTAKVLLSWQPLRVLPPRSQESHGWHPLVVWVIHVWEPEPPEGAEALEWVLLSSVPTQTFEDAQERVDWYRARWMVEDFHQGLKTGCQIEQRHLQDYEGLRTLLGLLAPMAVRLMQVRAASRQDPEQPASQVLPSDVVAVVAHLDHRPAETMTVQQCWHAIARSGGYLGRKSDGPPRVENPVARMAAYPNTARRRSSCTFAFSIKLVIQSQHQGPVYLISILENYSRAVLASKISPAQNQWDYLEVLFAAFSTAGVPKAIVSDGGGIFYCNQAMAVYQALGIEKERIAKKQA